MKKNGKSHLFIKLINGVKVTAIAWACVGFSANALAAEDSVALTVKGSIVDNTCTVDEAASDLTPTLVPISARDLKGKGTTRGHQDIKLVLKDCGKDITRGLKVTAQGEGDTDDANAAAFKNGATGQNAATGVGLHFYKSDKVTPFKPDASVSEEIKTLKEGNNTLMFAAAYVATAEEPAAGDFSALINFKLEYQ